MVALQTVFSQVFAMSGQELPELPYLLEPAELYKLQSQGFSRPSLLVVDVGTADSYTRGHVPGAVHLLYPWLVSGAPPAPGLMPETDQLEEVFNYLGLTPETHVVVYDDDGGGHAGRLLWTLDLVNHQHMSYLNGGLHAWAGAGLPLEQTLNRAEPSAERYHWDFSARATKADILSELNQPGFVIWDARNPTEYRGENVQALRGGHIPGAINCEWTNLLDRDRDLRIRSDAKDYLAKLGLDESKTIVTHCQAHRRSSLTYLVGKSLGFNIRGYDGSWGEWGNADDTPIEK